MQWPYPDRNDSLSNAKCKHSALLAGANLSVLQLPHPDRRSEEHPTAALDDDNNTAYTYSPLRPRFYSPTHLSARGFAEGETPSKNVSLLSLFPSYLHQQWGTHLALRCLSLERLPVFTPTAPLLLL
jgi:hypothetical protein